MPIYMLNTAELEKGSQNIKPLISPHLTAKLLYITTHHSSIYVCSILASNGSRLTWKLCMLLDAQITTHHSNIGVCSGVATE